MIGEDPVRPSTQSRDELATGVRSFHFQVAAGRRKGAAHVAYYIVLSDAGGAELVVLRVLPDEMEPLKRVARAIRQER
jgi:toxin ParE1/3/4